MGTAVVFIPEEEEEVAVRRRHRKSHIRTVASYDPVTRMVCGAFVARDCIGTETALILPVVLPVHRWSICCVIKSVCINILSDAAIIECGGGDDDDDE